MKPKTNLRQLIQFVLLMLRKPQMDLALSPEQDYRHTLQPGEHEAFYFLFTSPDGYITGGLRTLFGPDDVLEMMALKIGDQAWLQQQRVVLGAPPQPAEASGPSLHLLCEKPWQQWHARFSGTPAMATGSVQMLDLDLTFRATTPPARFQIGAYQQSQQDGRLTGTLKAGDDGWEGELICYRDHSWGQRSAGNAPGWMIIDIPEHLYAFIIGDMRRQLFAVGRVVTESGELRSVVAPRVREVQNGWTVADPKAGVAPWSFTRLTPAGVSYLGKPGKEAARSTSEEGDLYKDEIGPAVFTASSGEKVVGFWDKATRIKS